MGAVTRSLASDKASVRGSAGYYTRLRARNLRAFLLFTGPALFWFALWMLWPLGNMFYLSTLKWDRLVQPGEFIGLANYTRMLHDPHFFNGLRNTAIHLAVALPGVMIPAYMLGFFLSLRPPGYRLLRVMFFSPAMISVAALAVMFYGVYMPNGILNAILKALGLGAITRPWLADPYTVLGAIIFLDIWAGIGFYAVLFFAALSNMPIELIEAARLDGASLWVIMWRVTFPLIRGFFGVATMLHFLWILLGAAQNVLILTRGGPGDYSLTLGYYLYDQAFLTQRLGYSQAIGVFVFIVGIIGLLIIRRALRPSD
ncbi:MAG: carbohydrate ABC transporter permease [Anaerolineae bacterium]